MSKIIPFEKSFASHEKSKYWSDKNLLKPNDVMKGTHKKYIFNCDCGHEFESIISNIIKNRWCPYCCNPPKKLCNETECASCLEKSFASHEKAQCWSNKNNVLPRQLFKNSNTKYIFNCDKCNHEFSTELSNVIVGNWCPYCGNHKLCDNIECIDCHNKSFANHEKSKYWSLENKLSVRQVFKNSHTKYIFNCDKCFHSFETTLSDINTGCWCPYCSKPCKKLCDNNCNFCYNNSFASHEKSQYWSDKNVLKPNEVVKGTNKKFWFNCNICNHKFEQYISVIIRGGFCSYCNGDKLCDKDCDFCYNKSFASHEKAKYWCDKNNISPRQVSKQSHNKYLFQCNICYHIFDTILSNIIKNQWCSYCNGNHKICDKEDCKQCFEKSFASHYKAKYWSDKNELKPNQVFKNSNKKFIFNCDKCKKIFESRLANVVRNNWCPYCVNKTEQIVFDKLQPIYNNLQQQYKVDWCKNITYLPFDFVLEEQKIIIELDGRQHFEQVRNWDNPDKTQERDKYKMKQANNNGYSVIRLLQEDVYYDTYQWLEELKINIEKIITESKVQNIFMCQDDEYKIFEVLE